MRKYKGGVSGGCWLFHTSWTNLNYTLPVRDVNFHGKYKFITDIEAFGVRSIDFLPKLFWYLIEKIFQLGAVQKNISIVEGE